MAAFGRGEEEKEEEEEEEVEEWLKNRVTIGRELGAEKRYGDGSEYRAQRKQNKNETKLK